MTADAQATALKALQKLVAVCERVHGSSARVWFQWHFGQKREEITRIRERDQRDLEAARVTPLVRDEGSFPTLHERTMRRVSYQEARRQWNLEDILDVASRAILAAPSVSDEPVDDDWAIRFFAIAQDVSYEPMRKLWAMLLVHEVRRPGSFSMRCLESVRSLTRLEAEGLNKIARFVVNGEALLRNLEVGDLLQMREFHALVDAGVINGTTLQWEVPVPEARVQVADVLVQLTGQQPMVFEAWRLTGIGKQLVPLLDAKAHRPFIRWFLDEAGARDYRWTLHRMLSRDPLKWDPNPTRPHEL
jgi:hypothetical protein